MASLLREQECNVFFTAIRHMSARDEACVARSQTPEHAMRSHGHGAAWFRRLCLHLLAKSRKCLGVSLILLPLVVCRRAGVVATQSFENFVDGMDKFRSDGIGRLAFVEFRQRFGVLIPDSGPLKF